MTLQEIIFALERFWSERGLLIHQPWDAEVGAGTMHPETFFRVLGPKPWRVGYVQPSRRPGDGRYGENPNRLYKHEQLRVGAGLGRAHHREGQAVDFVLSLALGAEGVEQLGAAREEEGRVEARFARAERRMQQLRLAEPQQLGPLAAVERDPQLGQGLERGAVARPAAAGAAGHGPQLAPLAGQQHDDPAGFAQLMAPEHQGLGGEESHGERAWSNGKPG